MLRFINKRKGQNTAEYAILIGVIVAAAIAMQVYVRRGMQARIKDAVDYSKNNDTSGVFTSSQYEPYYMDSQLTTSQDTSRGESMALGGGVDRTANETMQRTGTVTYGNWNANN